MGRVSTGWITLKGTMLEIPYIRSGDNPSYLMTNLKIEDLSHEAIEIRKVVQNVMGNLGVAPAPENHIGGAIFDDNNYFLSSVTSLLFIMPKSDILPCGLTLQSTGRYGEYRRVGFWQATEARPDLSSL
jgi:hypothetical protein